MMICEMKRGGVLELEFLNIIGIFEMWFFRIFKVTSWGFRVGDCRCAV